MALLSAVDDPEPMASEQMARRPGDKILLARLDSRRCYGGEGRVGEPFVIAVCNISALPPEVRELGRYNSER